MQPAHVPRTQNYPKGSNSLAFGLRDLAEEEIAEDLDSLGAAELLRIDEIGVDPRALELRQHLDQVGGATVLVSV